MSARLSGLPAYVRLSKFMTLMSRVVFNRWRTKFEPINPAPPVIKTFKRIPPLAWGENISTALQKYLVCGPGVSRGWTSPGSLIGSGVGHKFRGVQRRFEGAGV